MQKTWISLVLEQYLDRYMKDHYKNNLMTEIYESVQESNSPIDKDIWIWRSRSSNVEVKNAEKLGFPHILGQYLERYIKENKKNTGLCT